MADIREILTEWTLASGSNFLTVMYFEAAIPVEDQRDALQAFWDGLAVGLDNSAVWKIRTEGREVEDTSGALTGAWSDPTPQTGTGDNTNEQVPDASQVLIQWKTASIVGKRFLRGRTFVPGLAVTAVVNGNLQPAGQATFQAAANAFIASAAGLVVWHRPVAGSGGSHDVVSTASVWSELAVLRRRRG